MENENLVLEKYMLMVNEQFNAEKYSEARETLEAALQISPTYGQAHSYLGWYYFAKLYNYLRAETHYELAMKYNPEFAGNYHNYCVVLFELKKFNQVMEVARLGLGVGGVDAAVMFHEMARAMEAKTEFKEAKKLCEQALFLATEEYLIETIKISRARLKSKIRRQTLWYILD